MSDDLVKRWDDHVESLCSPMSTIEHMAQKMRNRIEALNQEVKDLKKLVFAAYCEGFSDGKDGGWIVGPSNQPWKASDAHRMLKTMEAKHDY